MVKSVTMNSFIALRVRGIDEVACSPGNQEASKNKGLLIHDGEADGGTAVVSDAP